MQILPIDPRSSRDVRRFVSFPFSLYRGCPYWVPPLLSGEKAIFDSRRHPFYQKGEAMFFLAEHAGRIVGRLGVLNNRYANERLGLRVANFTAFDCIDDAGVAVALFQAGADWARLQGLDRLEGPVTMGAAPTSGVLVEGFDRRPPLGMPYNYPYYDGLVMEAGFEKDRDHLQGYISAAQPLPQRVQEIARQVKERRGFTVKSFRSRDELREWVPRVAKLTEVFAYDPRYVPLIDAEIAEFAETLIALADPRLLKLILKGDEVVGFIFSYHDISEGLQRARGLLWPVGWWHLLRARRTTRWCNVNGVGLLPKYQGLGGNVLLYAEIDRTLREFGFEHAYAVSIAEDNFKSRSDMETMGIVWVQRHRSYCRALGEG